LLTLAGSIMARAHSAERRTHTASFLLEDVRRRVRLPPTITPQDAIQATMCSLSQHVSGAEVRHVFLSLPPSIQPILGRCRAHREEPTSRFGRDELLRRIAEHLDVSLDEAERTTEAVLRAMSARLPAKEVPAVAAQLPLELRSLWVVRLPSLAP
jgi:uncharacterized protein (DUF2267 family)